MNRKEILIESATELFGENGYPETSTAMIGKHAKVSEALIFKHFQTKEGLLKAVLKAGFANIIISNKGMINENDPLAIIFKVLALPSLLVRQQPVFWKMQSRMLTNQEAAKEAQRNFIKPIYKILINAFTQLGYKEPENETKLLLMMVESLWKGMVNDDGFDCDTMTRLIQNKYSKEQEQKK